MILVQDVEAHVVLFLRDVPVAFQRLRLGCTNAGLEGKVDLVRDLNTYECMHLYNEREMHRERTKKRETERERENGRIHARVRAPTKRSRHLSGLGRIKSNCVLVGLRSV